MKKYINRPLFLAAIVISLVVGLEMPFNTFTEMIGQKVLKFIQGMNGRTNCVRHQSSYLYICKLKVATFS